jgi:hypothetical protein
VADGRRDVDIRDRDIDGDGSERQKFTVSSVYSPRYCSFYKMENVSLKNDIQFKQGLALFNKKKHVLKLLFCHVGSITAVCCFSFEHA